MSPASPIHAATPDQASVPPASPRASGRDQFLLVLLCLCLFGLGLGYAPLANPDEARYGEIPREMLASGDFVTPRLDGVKYFEKPPLTYWLVAGALGCFGPGDAAARAVPAVFATLGVLLTYAVGRALAGRTAGFLSAVVQATSLLYFVHARILLLDMVVSVLITAVLFCFILGVREPPGRRRQWLFLGMYAAAAGATLAKGLIGFLLPGAVIFLWLLLANQWHRLRPIHLPTGLLVYGLIALPWHVLVALRNPEWARFYFIHEHWLRYTTTTHGRHEPWWFFVPVVLAGLFPWTGFLWPALQRVVRPGPAGMSRSAPEFFAAVWAAFIIVFFSASQSKLVPYVLPALPPLALLIGLRLAAVLEAEKDKTWRAGLVVFCVLAGLLGTAFVTVWINPRLLNSTEHAAELQWFALCAGVVLLVGATVVAALYKMRRSRAALIALGTSAVAFALVLVVAAPAIARPSTRPLALAFAKVAAPGDRVLHYHDYFHDFTYYSGRFSGTVAYEGELELGLDAEARAGGRFVDEAGFEALWRGENRVFLVLRRTALSGLQSRPDFRARVVAETSRHVLLANHP